MRWVRRLSREKFSMLFTLVQPMLFWLIFFGNLFQRAGYATCIAGKWQLGKDPGLPRRFGFDEHCLWQHTRRPPRFANPGL